LRVTEDPLEAIEVLKDDVARERHNFEGQLPKSGLAFLVVILMEQAPETAYIIVDQQIHLRDGISDFG